jgi:hypothetical protein
VDDGEQDQPLVFGSLKSAKEHAAKIAERIRSVPDACGRAFHAGELAKLHAGLCAELDWLPRLWDAVGRELALLPGVKKGTVKIYGRRLTVYEIAPLEEVSAAVVELAGVERKRA